MAEKMEKTNMYLLVIVGIVAIVGIVVLILNASGGSISYVSSSDGINLAGQAVAASALYTCTDSDGGNVSQTFGNATITKNADGSIVKSVADRCKSQTIVYETTCSADAKIVVSEAPCRAGSICKYGACSLDSDKDGVPDSSDKCAGYDDKIDTDGDGIPDGCDLEPDLTHDEASTSFSLSGTGYTLEGNILGYDIVVNLGCGIRNDGLATAVTPSGGRTFSKCTSYVVDSSTSSPLISDSFSITSFSLAPGEIYTFGESNLMYSATEDRMDDDLKALLEEAYVGYANVNILYSIDSYTTSSARIVESDETNNNGEVTVSVDMSGLTWVEAECSTDSNCQSGCGCNSEDYQCYETYTSGSSTYFTTTEC